MHTHRVCIGAGNEPKASGRATTKNIGHRSAHYGARNNVHPEGCTYAPYGARNNVHPEGCTYAPPLVVHYNACPEGHAYGHLRVPIGAGNEPKASGRATTKKK